MDAPRQQLRLEERPDPCRNAAALLPEESRHRRGRLHSNCPRSRAAARQARRSDMGRYDWPGSPPATSDDRLALRNSYFQRLWRTVANGFLTGAAGELYDALARLAEAAITEAEIDRKRWLPIGPSIILRGRRAANPASPASARYQSQPRRYPHLRGERQWRRVVQRRGGLSWAPLGGMATTPDRNARGRSGNSLVIGCLYVEFRANADADTVYAGTGEPAYNYSDKRHPRFQKRRYWNPQAQPHRNGGARRPLRQPLGSRGAQSDRCRHLPHRPRSRSSP